MLEVVSVLPCLREPNQKIIEKLMIKARRDRTKAAIPKLSLTIVSRGKSTKLQEKSFSRRSEQNNTQLKRQKR